MFPLAGLAVAADGVPCVRVGEGETVGADADDVAVFFVESVDDKGEAAGEPGQGVGELGRRPEFGAGDAAERVEEEVVEGVGRCDEDDLRGRRGCQSWMLRGGG